MNENGCLLRSEDQRIQQKLLYITTVSPYFKSQFDDQLQDFIKAVDLLEEIGDKRQAIEAFKATFLRLVDERSAADRHFFTSLTNEQECGTLVDTIGTEAFGTVIRERIGSPLHSAEENEGNPSGGLETSSGDDTVAFEEIGANAPEISMANQSRGEPNNTGEAEESDVTTESQFEETANDQHDDSQAGDRSAGHAETSESDA